MSSIIFQRVSFPYPSGEILRNVSFTCGSGERLCLIGPNGAGKTTILRLARGELTPTEGQVDANAPPPRDTASDEATLSIADYLEFRFAHLHRIRERFHAVHPPAGRGERGMRRRGRRRDEAQTMRANTTTFSSR